MWLYLVMICMVVAPVLLILTIIFAIKKKKAWKGCLIGIAACAVLFIVAMFLPSDDAVKDNPEQTKQVETKKSTLPEKAGEQAEDPRRNIRYAVAVIILASVVVVVLRKKKSESTHQEQSSGRSKQTAAVSQDTPAWAKNKAYYHHLPDDQKLSVRNYIALDTETTGLSQHDDRIIEVSAIKVIDGAVVDHYETFINPERDIPQRITELTGITNADVANAPAEDKVAQELASFIGNLPIVAHNAAFDMGFVVDMMRRQKVVIDLRYIDTVRLAREAWPNLQNHKLETLIAALGINGGADQSHRAGDDADAARLVFEQARNILLNVGSKNNTNQRSNGMPPPKPRDNVAHCPRCGSTSLTANKKGFGAGKAIAGTFVLGPAGALAGGIGANKIKVTCLKCGYTYKL